MMTRMCKRCEYWHHDYENSLCPLTYSGPFGGMFTDYEDRKKAIDECDFMEYVHAPMSWWTKKEILKVCQGGGANPKTMEHLKSIKLEDLKLILLKKLTVEPRGMHSEIWKEAPQNWEHVRHTQMWGIDWDLIDKWNKIL